MNLENAFPPEFVSILVLAAIVFAVVRARKRRMTGDFEIDTSFDGGDGGGGGD